MIWEEKGSYLEALESNLNFEIAHTISQSKYVISLMAVSLCCLNWNLCSHPSSALIPLSHWIRQNHLIPQNQWASTHPYTLLVMSSDQQQADISLLFHRKVSLERSGNQIKFVHNQSTDCLCNTKNCHTEWQSPVMSLSLLYPAQVHGHAVELDLPLPRLLYLSHLPHSTIFFTKIPVVHRVLTFVSSRLIA